MSTEPPANSEPHDPSVSRLGFEHLGAEPTGIVEEPLNHYKNDLSSEPTSRDERWIRMAKEKEKAIDQLLAPSKADALRFTPFADVGQVTKGLDEAIEEQKRQGTGKSFGPVQVAYSGQKKTIRPKPSAATDQPMKPRSSAPKRRKGPQL
ncbi:hypothetical protein ABZ234_08335 [Nocardiopsis sp. NPDC006198]|uniref:hypothetical protein n=1 Tax=Nocardiopsis sp. NPDC006198 TaxID=3154472 RepID=UPI0033AED03C